MHPDMAAAFSASRDVAFELGSIDAAARLPGGEAMPVRILFEPQGEDSEGSLARITVRRSDLPTLPLGTVFECEGGKWKVETVLPGGLSVCSAQCVGERRHHPGG